MVKKIKWVERKFEFHDPVGVFPCVLSCLQGTPVRIGEITRNLPPGILVIRAADSWSIQENVGHLLDLEELGEKRLADFLSNADVLTPADMTNAKTHGGNHNSGSMKDLLQKFKDARQALVSKLADLSEEQVAISILHPRINKPMRIIDWAFFMAEHDDNHIARIIELAKTLQRG